MRYQQKTLIKIQLQERVFNRYIKVPYNLPKYKAICLIFQVVLIKWKEREKRIKKERISSVEIRLRIKNKLKLPRKNLLQLYSKNRKKKKQNLQLKLRRWMRV